MQEPKIKNAKITGTMLGYEDHHIMTCFLYLDYDGSGQGAGGYCLDDYSKKEDKRVGTKIGMDFIIAILDTVGVDKWENLPGEYIKVKMTHDKVHAIAPVLAEDDDGDKWLDFEKFFQKYHANV